MKSVAQAREIPFDPASGQTDDGASTSSEVASGTERGDEPVRFADDLALARRIDDGDEAAFEVLVGEHHGTFLRLARAVVSRPALAEEVVQEAWMAILDGLRTYRGRASLKTWMARVVINCARKHGVREGKAGTPGAHEPLGEEPIVDPANFSRLGFWCETPQHWDERTQEQLLLRKETRRLLEQEIAKLPEQQSTVLTLRDLEGWEAHEVCNLLEITEIHQRVLLHRARAKIRSAIEKQIRGGSDRW